MIDIHFDVSADQIFRQLIVCGHAGCGKKGRDIVCAAVSILVETIRVSLQAVPGTSLDFKDDRQTVILVLKDYQPGLAAELRGMTFYLLNGLQILANQYQQYIKLTIKGEGNGSS